MEPAHGRDGIDSRAEGEVVGVDKDDLGAEGLDLGVGQAFDRALAGHGHEGRGFDRPVRRFEEAGPGRGERVFGGRPKGGVHGANRK